MRLIKKERMRSMSLLIVVKTLNCIVFTSDSFSTYENRTLKDANYKKIHIFGENSGLLGITGLNVVYNDENNVVDINDIIDIYFGKIENFDIMDKIQEFNMFLKRSCDRFCKDISYVLAYHNFVYDISILNNQGIYIDIIPFYETNILVQGDEELKVWTANQFELSILENNSSYIIQYSKNIMEKAIALENLKNPEGQRTIGGKIQQEIIYFDSLKDEDFGRKAL